QFDRRKPELHRAVEDVPRGTMDEVSSHVCLVLPSTDGKAARKIVPPRLRIPYWKGLGADSEEKHEPVSDIDTVVVDSLKALDPKRPIREADIDQPAAPIAICEYTAKVSGQQRREHTFVALAVADSAEFERTSVLL